MNARAMNARALAAGLLIGAAGVWYMRQAQAGEEAEEGAATWADDIKTAAADAATWIKEAIMPTAIDLSNSNLRAFLRMIRAGEGTADADGYRRLFGGDLFDSYADHPRITVTARLGGKPITSTAAGAYQFLSRTWDEAKAALSLPDFSPASQDMAAAFLIRRRGALADVYAGNFESAVAKCAREWASLPGSPYGQPVKTLAQAQAVYLAHGGFLA
jgi:muramidase (phage lysozyme)